MQIRLKFTLICFGVTLSLLVGEAILRVVYPVCAVRYRFHQDIGTTLLPNQDSYCSAWEFQTVVHSNSAGFRDQERSLRKPKDTFRILVIGDSFIEALQVPYEHSFTQQLGSTLSVSNSNRDFEVINFGVSGNGVAQYLRLLEAKGLDYKPDLVIFAITIGNDFRDSNPVLANNPYARYYSLKDDQLSLLPTHTPSGERSRKGLAKHFRTLQILRESIRNTSIESFLARFGLLAHTPHAKGIGKGERELPVDWLVYRARLTPAWEETTQLVQALVSQASRVSMSSQSRFAVFFIPSVASVEQRWPEAFDRFGLQLVPEEWNFDGPRERLLSYCHQSQIACLDLTPAFRKDYRRTGESYAFKKDGHWNQAGHHAAAKRVAEFLMSKQLLNPRTSKTGERKASR